MGLRKTRLFLLVLAVVAVLGLSLLRRWEMGGETWGYWFFARVFAESRRFIIPGRSPLYTLYLNGFRWLGYPNSVTVEYLVTSIITVTAMVALFRRYLGLILAILAALLWIPFLQVAEPPVQKLALACSCWAIVARRIRADRFGKAGSYALFGLAYLFRPTYIIFIPVFAAWDILQSVKQRASRRSLAAVLLPRPTSDWPVMLVIGLLIWFQAMQSPEPWNNIWYASTTWLPADGKTFTLVQAYNWPYIELKYGTFEGHDFYFTNQELFGGASDNLGMIRANPRFVIEQIGRNTRSVIPIAAGLTELPGVYSWLPGSGYLALLAIVAIFYGAFRASKDASMNLFVIGNIFCIGAAVVALPRTRYMPPLIPVLILSAYWYGTQAHNILAKSLLRSGLIGVGLLSLYLILRIAFAPPGPLTLSAAAIGYVITFALVAIGGYGSQDVQDLAARWLSHVGHLAVPLALVFFSTGATDWLRLAQNVVSDIRRGEVWVLERRNRSIKASFEVLEPLVRDCKGVMALESTFIGAFMNVPLDRVYDVWEIPPFGHLGDSAYDGLRPDRINCVLVSHELATGIGYASNYQIRYQNYVKPYVEQLQDMGATTYAIQEFGQAVILPKSP